MYQTVFPNSVELVTTKIKHKFDSSSAAKSCKAVKNKIILKKFVKCFYIQMYAKIQLNQLHLMLHRILTVYELLKAVKLSKIEFCTINLLRGFIAICKYSLKVIAYKITANLDSLSAVTSYQAVKNRVLLQKFVNCFCMQLYAKNQLNWLHTNYTLF